MSLCVLYLDKSVKVVSLVSTHIPGKVGQQSNLRILNSKCHKLLFVSLLATNQIFCSMNLHGPNSLILVSHLYYCVFIHSQQIFLAKEVDKRNGRMISAN